MNFPVALLDPRTAPTSSAQPSRQVAFSSTASSELGKRAVVADLPSVIVGRIYASVAELVTGMSPWLRARAELQRLRQVRVGWDSYGAPPPSELGIVTADKVLSRAFQNGLAPTAIVPSAEGGVFFAFDGDGNRRANIECFNDGTVYGAILADSVTVWPVSSEEPGDLDAAIHRISEHLASS